MQKRDATIVYDLGQILEMDADLTPCKGTTNVKLNDSVVSLARVRRSLRE